VSKKIVAVGVYVLCAACGSSSGDGTGGTGGSSQTTASNAGNTSSPSSSASGMTGGIPDPGAGSQVDQDFTSKEPNNTPQQATPLGTSMLSGVNVWVNGNTVGGATNNADYFVFKSGPQAGPFTFDVCFSAPLTGLTATLWKVVGGQEQMPPVGTWMSTSTCVTNQGMMVQLDASTDYLFGLTAAGDSGTYQA
jgi:hypothetical protein